MMREKTKCQSVTLYTHLGEDERGRARWGVTRVDGAAVFVRKGVRAGQPEAESSRAVVYIFEKASGLKKQYVDEDVFDEMVDREDVYTLHTDGRDRMYMGLSWSDTPPGGGKTMRPVAVTYNDKGRPGMHHVKVVCG